VAEPRALPVYLIHWNAPEWCASATASILRSVDVAVDVTVVDNGQSRGTPLDTLLPASVRVLPQAENKGYTGGANVALDDWRARFPTAELCVIGSHDLHVEPDTFARLVAVADHEPASGVLAPALIAPNRRAGGRWNGRRAYQLGLDGAPELVRRDWTSGTCLLLRRACVDAVGPFDERLGSYVEDVDYGLRANDAGWQVLVVTGATARGLGAASPTSVAHIAANTVLLNAKRRGASGALDSFALFTWWAMRGLLASVIPWRERGRRAVSRAYALQRLRALYRIVSTRQLARMLRERTAAH
jgi:N-acetylglucosaminyl-diphospho-decaprenol L-rhamnosyltransferase